MLFTSFHPWLSVFFYFFIFFILDLAYMDLELVRTVRNKSMLLLLLDYAELSNISKTLTTDYNKMEYFLPSELFLKELPRVLMKVHILVTRILPG